MSRRKIKIKRNKRNAGIDIDVDGRKIKECDLMRDDLGEEDHIVRGIVEALKETAGDIFLRHIGTEERKTGT